MRICFSCNLIDFKPKGNVLQFFILLRSVDRIVAKLDASERKRYVLDCVLPFQFRNGTGGFTFEHVRFHKSDQLVDDIIARDEKHKYDFLFIRGRNEAFHLVEKSRHSAKSCSIWPSSTICTTRTSWADWTASSSIPASFFPDGAECRTLSPLPAWQGEILGSGAATQNPGAAPVRRASRWRTVHPAAWRAFASDLGRRHPAALRTCCRHQSRYPDSQKVSEDEAQRPLSFHRRQLSEDGTAIAAHTRRRRLRSKVDVDDQKDDRPKRHRHRAALRQYLGPKSVSFVLVADHRMHGTRCPCPDDENNRQSRLVG